MQLEPTPWVGRYLTSFRGTHHYSSQSGKFPVSFSFSFYAYAFEKITLASTKTPTQMQMKTGGTHSTEGHRIIGTHATRMDYVRIHGVFTRYTKQGLDPKYR
ncbi:hypothetical protein, unlikely [Trypanosoma brucei gambiense DAL972]|uniref:Uncharacterized protein n=1 Tax=Trypanosoma brucei gambiense (strain MHOM/CI/86/DAL972) TaxID=679716 RepID=C9ZYM4_TRYB9|nr:hypothetical protein, unlikely [Trypanosoma brucei gambiense DAL972]CBH14523.1 hypothetical protein, unlikely [Trypanosoma brucei gambiense DAL972]|eukprot:XP_011776789.1 hypothetical protein, unlikely [Trypanosoma brucei gambiense DAL972]